MKNMPEKAFRIHQFPPLRNAWHRSDKAHSETDAAVYQQQVREGFQQGLNDGFEQGLAQGMKQGAQQGKEEGRKEGYDQGQQIGRKEAHTYFIKAAEPLDQLLHQAQQQLDEQDHRRRQELLQLVEKVTRQVIRCELALQPTQLVALIDEALSGLPEAPSRLRVLLNPEEFARIRELEPAKVKRWNMAAEPTLEPGECRIVTDTTEMDVGCNHRLNQCMEVLQQNLLESDSAGQSVTCEAIGSER